MAKEVSKTNGKRSQTVRERTQAGSQKPKERRTKRTLKVASKPLTTVGRGAKKAAKPLAFLSRPFKTKPMRFIGRILSKVLLINYFRSSWQELRQVTWPNRRETAKLTVAVFIFALIFSIAIALVDYGLDKVFKRILLS